MCCLSFFYAEYVGEYVKSYIIADRGDKVISSLIPSAQYPHGDILKRRKKGYPCPHNLYGSGENRLSLSSSPDSQARKHSMRVMSIMAPDPEKIWQFPKQNSCPVFKFM